MKNHLKNSFHTLQRPLYFLAALAMVVGLASGIVEAAAGGGQIQSRSIKLSDNGVSGGTITSGEGSGTNVTYRVSFTAATNYSLEGIVVDFCAGSGTPFIGDSNCTAPNGFTVGATPTVDLSAYQDNTTGTPVNYTSLGTVGWTTGSLNSGQTFYMTNSSNPLSVVAGTSYSFAITGVTNPSDLGTFYGRLMTYTSAATPPTYTHSAPGAYQDYGGFALSTANVVQVTAKVQETLSFCVAGSATPPPSAPTAPTVCAGAPVPAITIGHGTNDTLDGSAIDTGTVYTLASTNALNGLAIRMRNSNADAGNSCGGLSTDGGATCMIPAVGTGGALPSTMVAGTAAFGMRCNPSTGGTGSVSCDTDYYNGTATDYAMDTTSVGDNVLTTYGDRVAYSGGPVSDVTNEYDFAATASNTTPAGIYTANLAMIATGTF